MGFKSRHYNKCKNYFDCRIPKNYMNANFKTLFNSSKCLNARLMLRK